MTPSGCWHTHEGSPGIGGHRTGMLLGRGVGGESLHPPGQT